MYLFACVGQVARRGAVLYFVLAELANIDVMYQYSLDWFQQMFASCIASPVTNTLQGDVSMISSTSSTFATGILHPSSAHTIQSAEDFEKDTSLGTHSLPNDGEIFAQLWSSIFLNDFSLMICFVKNTH